MLKLIFNFDKWKLKKIKKASQVGEQCEKYKIIEKFTILEIKTTNSIQSLNALKIGLSMILIKNSLVRLFLFILITIIKRTIKSKKKI